MRQLSLADRGQTVSLDKALDDLAPTCMGVARLGSLQTAGSSFTVWLQVRGSSWVEAKEGRFRLRHGEWIAFEKESRSEEHTSELQSQSNLVCRLLLEKKKKKN